MITLRFVTGSSPISALIRAQARQVDPFTPSHVEAVVPGPDGGNLGAHFDGGMMMRPVGYDKDTMLHELFVDLPATLEQTNQFYAGLRSRIGDPYDWRAIVGFALPLLNIHGGGFICSAVQADELQACGFLQKLAVPVWEISPRDLLLILSGKVLI